MKNYFAIIDESGRLYDPEDRFLVFAAVITETLVNLDKIIPQVKKKLPMFRWRILLLALFG